MALAQCRTAPRPGTQRVGAPTTSDAARHVASSATRPWPRSRARSRPRSTGSWCCADESRTTPRTSRGSSALARSRASTATSHGPWSTALRVITGHEPGALHAAIEPFRYHRVNMTSLHSRPIMGQPWRYQFYIEIDGHRTDDEVLRALRDVGERSAFLETLGSYPVWRRP